MSLSQKYANDPPRRVFRPRFIYFVACCSIFRLASFVVLTLIPMTYFLVVPYEKTYVGDNTVEIEQARRHQPYSAFLFEAALSRTPFVLTFFESFYSTGVRHAIFEALVHGPVHDPDDPRGLYPVLLVLPAGPDRGKTN